MLRKRGSEFALTQFAQQLRQLCGKQCLRQRQRQWRIHLVLHFWPDISQQRLPTTWVRAAVYPRGWILLIDLDAVVESVLLSN